MARAVHQIRSWGSALLCALSVAACTAPPLPIEPTLKPPTRPAAPKPAPPKPVKVAKPTSEKSAALRSYLAQVQAAQLSQGLLRRDGGGADTPFSADILARNFVQIALFNEYDGNFSGRGGASPLRRWAAPVRMQVIFGDGVAASQRTRDAAAVRSYASRLARVSGHPVTTGGTPNFIVVIAGEDDRAEALAQAAARIPGITTGSLRSFRDLPREVYCAVGVYSAGTNPNTYTAAVAVIRAENPDLLRTSCIHEELAQGLGLGNDSPAARPSIFNDDDEFALLTRHDELLLRMLYDRRLQIGMNAAQASPIARQIARELVGGPV